MGYAFALLIGLSLGVMGGGGSILTVPIFVYAMGFAPKQAIAMSLPVVGATSLVGALGQWREGNLAPRAALVFGVLAMIGAFAGARLAAHVAGVVQLVLLGVVMVVAGTMMLRGSRLTTPGSRPSAESPLAAPGAGSPRARPLVTAVVGLSVGALTGLVGVGGGFLFVPALVLLVDVPMKTAVGTSLLVIALNTASATLGYRGQVDVPWRVIALFTAIAIVGIVLGTRVVRRVSQGTLRRAFAYFLFVVAAFILYQNRGVLADPSAAMRPSNAGARR